MKKTITYEQFLNKKKQIKELQDQGVVFLFKKNKIKLVLGVSCLAIAIFPNGLGLIFYPLGFWLLGIGMSDLFRLKEEIIRRLKNKWLKR